MSAIGNILAKHKGTKYSVSYECILKTENICYLQKPSFLTCPTFCVHLCVYFNCAAIVADLP